MGVKTWLFGILSLFLVSEATITSDTGCSCALTKGSTTTPNASASVNVGCSFKTDWNGQSTEWCLTDQTYGSCATFQTGFGYADFCGNANILNAQIQPQPLIEWDQVPYTFYTGQTINITWDFNNIQPDEWLRIQYTANGGARVLTTGSGVNITAKQYAVRLSDNTNMLGANIPVSLALPSTAAITNTTAQTITVIQSKLMNIGLVNNNAVVTNGQTLLCDNGNLSISWRGLGQAQFGLATVTVKSGGGTTVGTALSNIPVSGNVTVNYTLPRSFNPNGGSTYTAQISVQEPGQNAYTGNSVGFRLSAAPSTSPTPTPSQTPSRSPTPSISMSPTPTPTPSITPSVSSSPTPTPSLTASVTPTMTPTPSPTPSAAPSVDLALIARNAAQAVDTTTPAIAGALGGIGGVFIIIGALKWYQNKVLTEKRRKKLAMSARWVKEAGNVYGVPQLGSHDEEETPVQPSIVMYTVSGMPPRKEPLGRQANTLKKSFAPNPIATKGGKN